jgi:CBS domain-containing protein
MLDELTVGDIMTREVISVSPDTPLKAVAELLVDRRISGVPVTEADGTLVGVLTESDLLDEKRRRVAIPRMMLFGVYTLPEKLLQEAWEEGGKLTAADVMTRRLFTLPEDAPALQAANAIVERKINRIPIVRDGKLVGLVTRADILRAMARSWGGAERRRASPA